MKGEVEVISKNVVRVTVGDVALTKALKRRRAIVKEEHKRVVRYAKRLTAYICDAKRYAAAAKEVRAGAKERLKRREAYRQKDTDRGIELITRLFPGMPAEDVECAAESTWWPITWSKRKLDQHVDRTVRNHIDGLLFEEMSYGFHITGADFRSSLRRTLREWQVPPPVIPIDARKCSDGGAT